MSVLLALLALLVELAIGYPDRVYRAIGHPVSWMGRWIAAVDRRFNRDASSFAARRAAGIVVLAILVLVSGGAAWLVQTVLGSGVGILVTAILASTLLAQRSLANHVAKVADALETSGIESARAAVSHIVGRDPAGLDAAAVSRAAIESLSENFSDGVVAPAFWLAVAGLPGAVIYKTVNTADSMIGHRTPRHRAFGWAAARFDDLINLPASRLTALLIVLAAFSLRDASPGEAWRAVRRDAHRHRSPNAGWPEAAMAGALGLALNGPRSYGGTIVDDVFMGEGGRQKATANDIRRALRLYWRTDLILIALIGAVAALVMLHG
ncbi:MAG: adenosylcobinamide-phosphate synthase CbiB [Dongiaceae bacterium]